METKLNISFTRKAFLQEEVLLPLSKSVCNRALIINHFSGEPFPEMLLSDADDSQFLQKALLNGSAEKKTGEGGTTFRFLLAYFALHTKKSLVLIPSGPMLKRPIKPLVEALNNMGCSIEYLENEGFAPVKISPSKSLQLQNISVDTSDSSQFISAILLACYGLNESVTVRFSKEIVSKLYLELTIDLLRNSGAEILVTPTEIQLNPPKIKKPFLYAEPDWSAVQYPLSMLAILGKGQLFFPNLFQHQLQGDVAICSIFADFGIDFLKKEKGLLAVKNNASLPLLLERDFYNNPDVAQAYVCCAFALGITVKATGLKTLLNKETNRILALKSELEKLGAFVEIGHDWITVSGEIGSTENIIIDTYNDHRMAMSFAPLAINAGSITINAPYVVTKSFPNFWKLCSDLGFQI